MISLQVFGLIGIAGAISIINIAALRARRSIGMALVALTLFVTLIVGFVSVLILMHFPPLFLEFSD
ncbi:hypothetical protein HYT26_04890 [Candidatus Pacearchaeota archaeon]|nr:hypothetical protein [Candidatus Pacearchaeota archaeon]